MAMPFIPSFALKGYLEKLKGPAFEKNIPWMYADTVGQVTVGVGHNLTANGDATDLEFVVKRFERHAVIGGDRGVPILVNKQVGRRATAAEIQNDYDFIELHKKLGQFGAEQLSKYTTLELPQPAIDSVFAGDLTDAAHIAWREFSASFATYPDPAKAALIDIAFNCGGFTSFRHHFVPAIKGTGVYARKSMSERWNIAAANCYRGKCQSLRNTIVAQWLKDAANMAAHA